MSSQQDFEALAKLRMEVAQDIEMRRYQLEGIDLAIECLRTTAKPLAGAAAAAVAGKNAGAGKTPAGSAKIPAVVPEPEPESTAAEEPPAHPSTTRARLSAVPDTAK